MVNFGYGRLCGLNLKCFNRQKNQQGFLLFINCACANAKYFV